MPPKYSSDSKSAPATKSMDKKKSSKQPAKGSQEMKDKMARLRAMRGKKGK